MREIGVSLNTLISGQFDSDKGVSHFLSGLAPVPVLCGEALNPGLISKTCPFEYEEWLIRGPGFGLGQIWSATDRVVGESVLIRGRLLKASSAGSSAGALSWDDRK